MQLKIKRRTESSMQRNKP